MTEQPTDSQPPLNTSMPASIPQRKPKLVKLFFAVLFPLGVIVFEWVSGMCAEMFFDPMPTLMHKLLVLSVPVINFLLWLHLNDKTTFSVKNLLLLGSFSTGVAGYYTLLFLPLAPLEHRSV